jgi:TolA-binding protein
MKRLLSLYGLASMQSLVLCAEPLFFKEDLSAMQAIEPGFMPAHQDAVDLFKLQEFVAKEEEELKNKHEEATRLSRISSQHFRDSLNKFTDEKIARLDINYQANIEELLSYYELALKNAPENSFSSAEIMYFLGLYYFEIDEKEYFARLALYSKAKEEEHENLAYPEENFTRTRNLYEKLIKEYPYFYNLNDVYYLLALSYWYEGDFFEAVSNFLLLIKKYPLSRYNNEVYFRLGEYYYDMDEYKKARDYYNQVDKNSGFYDKAIYKLAWTYYQQNYFDKAIEYFIKTFDFTHDEIGHGTAALMRSEVIKYLIKSFSEKLYDDSHKLSYNKQKEYAEYMGKKLFKSVRDYLNKEEYAYRQDIYLELASQLLDELKSEGAVLALEEIIRLNPRSADNPRIESQIIDIWQEDHKNEAAQNAALALISRYNKESDWYKAHDKKSQRIAQDAVRDAMLFLAVDYHRLAKAFKAQKKEEYARSNFDKAAALYIRYVQEYPERDDSAKALFYYAESNYELQRFEEALSAYELVNNYPLPIANNLRREASYNILFTFKDLMRQEAQFGRFKHVDFDVIKIQDSGLTKEQIPRLGLRYLAAIDSFIKQAPQDDHAPILLYYAAALYYAYGDKEKAIEKLYIIINKYAQSDAAFVAARFIIDDASSRGEWALAAHDAKKFLEHNIGGRKDDFAGLLANANFKMALAVYNKADELKAQGALLEAQKQYKESALIFENLLKKDPKSPHAAIILWNIARALAQSGNSVLALPFYRRIYQEHARNDYAPQARFQEALALEKMLKFAEATVAYDGIIQHSPKSPYAQDAMLNKALLFEMAKENNKAIMAFIAFAKSFPNHAEAPHAWLKAASIYKEDNNLAKHINILEEFIKHYRRDLSKKAALIEAYVESAESYGELSRKLSGTQKTKYSKTQQEHYRAALALFSQDLPEEAAFYAAKAQLFLEKPAMDAFMKMSIKGQSSKAQREQLAAMTKELARLSAKNEMIIRTFAPAVASAQSLYRIGLLYEHLAHAMLNAPCPRDVDEIDEYACDEYIVLLEDKAAILEDKALDALLKAYEIVGKTFDAPASLVDTIQSALNRLRPGVYQRLGQLIEKPLSGAFYGQGPMLSTERMASERALEKQEPKNE